MYFTKIFLFLALVSAGCGALVTAKPGAVSLRRVLICVFLFAFAISMFLFGLSKIMWGIGAMFIGLISLMAVRFTRPERGSA
jgi:hypothetical protein